MRESIPLAVPDLLGNESKYVLDAMESTWISSSGPYVKSFEDQFASVAGSGHALAVCNGTVALHLALLGLNVRPGDEIIVPSLTYIATANAVRYVGADPVFVDVDPETWCLDPAAIEDSITNRTRGIIAVHLYGHPADMDAINRIADVHGLWVVEDAAEAPYATYKGEKVGSLARIATFSFYGNKVLTSGEGGAVTFSDNHLLTRLSMLRGQGMDPDRRYYFPITGYNFRLTNLACAILCAQIERADAMLAARRSLISRYNDALADIPGIGQQPVAPWATVSPWLYCATVDPLGYGHTRNELMDHLEAHGIETRPFFIPLHRLPPFRTSKVEPSVLANTDALSISGMNLPTFTQMTSSQLDRVCQVIADFAR